MIHKPFGRSLLLTTVAALALPAMAVRAETTTTPATTTPAEPAPAIDAAATDAAPPERDRGADIIVSGTLERSERDVLSGTSVLSGAELTRSLQPTIGETLARQPGVSATSFGPNASRPVLRGFQGDRIRVLTDGIGSIDVSNTSVDHAVVINPLLAERVEVLRGPVALVYGSSAAGGVVNVIDRRIPRTVPTKGYDLAGLATYGTAADEGSVALAGDVALTDRLVLHADGSYLRTNDLSIPGFALSPRARAEALASAALPPAEPEEGEEPIDFASNAAIRGTLPNTASETWTAGVGASLITDGGDFGVAYSHYASLYGVPIRYATRPGQGQESPRIDIVQNRVDIRADVNADGWFDKLRFRAGAADYRQFELEPSGEIGTAFYNKGFEARFEAIQARRGAWAGGSGVQVSNREFDVVGEEAFLPRSTTTQVGIFTQQQLDFGAFKAEAGIRYEHTDVASRVIEGDLRYPRASRRFDAVSAAVGGSYAVTPSLRLGINGSRTERAPSAEELFANGAHAGTQSYELGSPDFGLERAWGVEGTLHLHHPRYSLDASVYYNWFNGFISDVQTDQAVCEAAAAPSGRTVDLPCFQLRQDRARYYGFELEGSVKLAQIGAFAINADALGDYVHATIDGVGPAPRIPAGRVLAGLEAQSSLIDGRIEVERVFDQTRTATFETPTSGYTLVNFSLAITPFADKRTSLTLSANNLTNADARRAASFLKDFAPLAGRDIRLTARFAL